MARADGTPRPHTLIGWVVSLLVFLVAVAYVCTWWGAGARWVRPWLPEPLGDFSRLIQARASHWHRSHFGGWLGLQLAIGLVPALVLMAFRRKPGALGLGKFNVLGWRLIAISVLISIPFGFLLMHTGAVTLPRDLRDTIRQLGNLSAIIPEHMLICGLFVALMMPGRRLPRNVPLAPVQGPWGRRILRWLGLAQPVEAKGNRVLAWFGLSAASLLAIVASGILFWLAHLGKPDIVEVSLSLPGGVAVAYVTLRSRSIWPAVVAHFTMNLIPGGIALLFR